MRAWSFVSPNMLKLLDGEADPGRNGISSIGDEGVGVEVRIALLEEGALDVDENKGEGFLVGDKGNFKVFHESFIFHFL